MIPCCILHPSKLETFNMTRYILILIGIQCLMYQATASNKDCNGNDIQCKLKTLQDKFEEFQKQLDQDETNLNSTIEKVDNNLDKIEENSDILATKLVEVAANDAMIDAKGANIDNFIVDKTDDGKDVGNLIINLEKKVDANRVKIDANLATIDAKSALIDVKVGANHDKIEANAAKVDSNQADIDKIGATIDANSAKIDTIDAKVETNLAKINAKADAINAKGAMIDDLTPKVNANRAKLDANAIKINANAGQINANKAKIATNAEDVVKNSANIDNHQSKLEDLQQEVDQTESKIKTYSDKIQENEGNIKNISAFKEDITKNQRKVYFAVGRQEKDKLTLQYNILKSDRNQRQRSGWITYTTNELKGKDNNGMNIKTGRFVVPICGNYAFDFHIRSVYQYQWNFKVWVNNEVVRDYDANTNGATRSKPKTWYSSWMLYLKKGDTIAIQVITSSSSISNSNIHFSGLLIKADGTCKDECSPGYFGYPKCRKCQCSAKGTVGNTCDRKTGECTCGRLFIGHNCRTRKYPESEIENILCIFF